jgi:hypothetical protein
MAPSSIECRAFAFDLTARKIPRRDSVASDGAMPAPMGSRAYFSDRDDIGNAISKEKPSFERGWPGSFGSQARGEPSSAIFGPVGSGDFVRPAIGSFVKAGASQAERGSEVFGPAFFGRICDLHRTSGFYEIGSAMARTGLIPAVARQRAAWHHIPCMIRFFSIYGGIRQQDQLPSRS